MNNMNAQLVDKQITDELCEWSIMHGVAFKNRDGTASHCPFSLAPMSMKRGVYQHLLQVTPLLT